MGPCVLCDTASSTWGSCRCRVSGTVTPAKSYSEDWVFIRAAESAAAPEEEEEEEEEEEGPALDSPWSVIVGPGAFYFEKIHWVVRGKS